MTIKRTPIPTFENFKAGNINESTPSADGLFVGFTGAPPNYPGKTRLVKAEDLNKAQDILDLTNVIPLSQYLTDFKQNLKEIMDDVEKAGDVWPTEMGQKVEIDKVAL